MATLPVTLTHFAASEFKHPDLMNADFLKFVDAARDGSGVAWTLTSDARTPAENAAASGSSPTSLHLQGRAVDFVPATWDEKSLWQVAAGVFQATGKGQSVELELVNGNGAIPAAKVTADLVQKIRAAATPAKALAVLKGQQSSDKHIHLGRFADTRASRLIVAAD